MHVFLTGDKQIGKSTAVRQIAAKLGCETAGFLSGFRQGERGTELFLLPVNGQAAMDAQHLTAIRQNGHMTAIPGAFDRIGVPLLEQAMKGEAQLIIMDEIGHLEREAQGFRGAIMRCLDGHVPVLGVLRRDVPWHDTIRRHPRVRVLTVTEENRDRIADEAIALLTQRDFHGEDSPRIPVHSEQSKNR